MLKHQPAFTRQQRRAQARNQSKQAVQSGDIKCEFGYTKSPQGFLFWADLGSLGVILLSDKAYSTFEEARAEAVLAVQDYLDRAEGLTVTDIKNI